MFTFHDIFQGNPGLIEYQPVSPPDLSLTFPAANHDSRQIRPGDLFVALRGAQADGHDFIPKAVEQGARAILCSRFTPDLPENVLQIRVPDVLAALQATARVRAARQQQATFIGITGSNGKTSTKDAIASVLGTIAPTHKTQASYNHEIGYPLTLLRMEEEHRYIVLEMGAQWVGELAGLCQTVWAPNWSVITNVGSSHLEYFGSQERIALAKSELVQVLKPEGLAVLNADDPLVSAMAAKTVARVMTYGQHEPSTVAAIEVSGDPLFGLSFTLVYKAEERRVDLKLPGEHGITIALAAATVGLAAGMTLTQVAVALESLRPSPRRGEIKAGPNGSVLIDDSYNASRQSMQAILQAVKQSERRGKRWALLGDMFELGDYAPAEHRAVGETAAASVDYLIAIGELAASYLEGAREAGMSEEQLFWFPANVEQASSLREAQQAAAALLLERLQADDLLVIKGSMGMRLERLIALLVADQIKK